MRPPSLRAEAAYSDIRPMAKTSIEIGDCQFLSSYWSLSRYLPYQRGNYTPPDYATVAQENFQSVSSGSIINNRWAKARHLVTKQGLYQPVGYMSAAEQSYKKLPAALLSTVNPSK